MSEIMFYHLEHGALHQALPTLLLKSLEKGWSAVVHCSSEEQCHALDGVLWTWREDSFLPHGAMPNDFAQDQPVLLTTKDENPNGAPIRFCLGGVALPSDLSAYERVIVMFEGDEDLALNNARAQWKEVKQTSHDCTYWQQNSEGQWQKKA